MQISAAFLGGAVLGGLITAACGWDLFPEESQAGALASARDECARSKTQLGKAKEALARSASDARELAGKLEAAEAKARDCGALGARLRSMEEGLSETRAAAAAAALKARSDVSRLEGEVSGLKARAEAAESVASRTLREGGLRQLVRFFSRERGPDDAVLVSEFLATAAPPDEKKSLILELIKANKEVLMALPRPAADLHTNEAAPLPSSAKSEP